VPQKWRRVIETAWWRQGGRDRAISLPWQSPLRISRGLVHAAPCTRPPRWDQDENHAWNTPPPARGRPPGTWRECLTSVDPGFNGGGPASTGMGSARPARRAVCGEAGTGVLKPTYGLRSTSASAMSSARWYTCALPSWVTRKSPPVANSAGPPGTGTFSRTLSSGMGRPVQLTRVTSKP